jgi:microcystin-dependent protein
VPVASETSRIQYTGNNSTVTAYTVPFYFLANADVKVVVTTAAGVETLLTETTHYTLTGAANPAGGSLTTVSAYDNAHTITIYREPQQTQTAEFQPTGALPAATLTAGLDKLTMLVQSLSRKVSRCFRFNDKAADVSAISESGRSSTVFGFDSGGNASLYDTEALLSLLSLSGSITGASTAYWADNGERALKVPDFNGQLGLQLDTSALYRSTGTSAGNWSLLALDEDDMASDSALRTATQQSVKAYVETRFSASVSLPTGTILDYAGGGAPTGFLQCYGQAVSRTTYAALFATLSTAYGAGDGSTTFNLPDLRGRVGVGKDNMGGSAASRMTTGGSGVDGIALGATGGSQTHTLDSTQMPAHTHAPLSGTSPAFMHSVASGGTGTMGGGTIIGTAATTGSTGGGLAHNNTQPSIILNKIIKT